MSKLSDKLQKLLEQCGMTPAELSRASGVPQARISEIVSGKTLNPQLKTLQKLSAVLNEELSPSQNVFISYSNENYASGLIRPEEQDLLSKFRRLDDRQRGNILEIIEGYEALSKVENELGGRNPPDKSEW